MSKRTRVVLADDHCLVRAGIRALLEAAASVEVVAEASDGCEAVRLTHQHQPDLLLMDLSMKGLNGIDATVQIRSQLPHVRVIILSMYSTEDHVSRAFASGASGYIIKDAATEELELAIAAVMQGSSYLSRGISAGMASVLTRQVRGAERPAANLTPRQREILHHVVQGHSTRQIAHLLSLSIKTVETHRAQIMGRLGIYHVPGLVRYALEMGLIEVGWQGSLRA